MPPTLEIKTKSDANRLRCPRGHSSVAPTNHHWYCRACANNHEDDDPELETVLDAVTGYEYTRDDVELDFDVPGVYYA